MDIIVTHDMSDFDGFASCVAAQRLYAGATIVLGRTLGEPLRRFLALHKDRFPAIRYSELDPAEVRRLVAVDVRRRSRLGTYAEVLRRVDAGEVEVHVWDHHPATDDDLHAAEEVVEPVGSATTLLVEELRRRDVPIDPLEATLFAVGIHQDTGSLTYAATTSRDARAVAWALDRGASLSVLNRYLRPAFGAAQREALQRVLDGAETVSIGGVPVAFAVVSLDRPIDGLDEVTSHAIELGGHQALFALYEVGQDRVQVVGRAQRSFFDVGRILASVGGGGHPPAGSAIVKGSHAVRVHETLLRALRADPPRPTRVSEIMSSPVRTVPHDTSFDEVRRLLDASHITGLPVMRDGKMAGIVSRRDVVRAMQDGDAALPVSARMTHVVRTTVPGAPLEEALALMTEHDVGRLPVLRRGRLVGIVTRADVLRVLYE